MHEKTKYTQYSFNAVMLSNGPTLFAILNISNKLHLLDVIHDYIVTAVQGRFPTEATRLRFDQEKVDYTLIHDETSSHRGRAGGRSAITN
jgi:hypothetical protein